MCGYVWLIELWFDLIECCFCVDKDRELGEAQAEIKALKLSERLREKAVEEVSLLFDLNLIF